jgi:hypothetical protein
MARLNNLAIPFYGSQQELEMADQILLYISAATDLESERDILTRGVAEIPTDLAWRITLSPRGNEAIDTNALLKADVHLLLLGEDIRAPVGHEWIMARRAGRRPQPFLKEESQRTSAGQNFVRFVETSTSWEQFRNPLDLRLKVLLLLSRHILQKALPYSLSPTEVDRLQSWRRELEDGDTALNSATVGGAGESSLILSKERFVPSEGVLLGNDE